MTSPECPNGTARIASILDQLEAELVVNLQGDEPFVAPALLDALVEDWRREPVDVVTAVRPVDTVEELTDPSLVKAVLSAGDQALYFSRSPIPHLRDAPLESWLERRPYWAHVGIYGYARETLARYEKLAIGDLEQAEKLEQLRFLENGLAIRAVKTDYRPMGIDTVEDLARARAFCQNRPQAIQ